MKNYDEITKKLLDRRDVYVLRQKEKRNLMIKVSVLSLACLCFTLSLVMHHKDDGSSTLVQHDGLSFNDVKYKDYRSTLEKAQVETILSNADFAIDISNVSELRDHTTNIFLATIDSIDGCSTVVATNQFSPMPHTYGTLTVLENLKGEVSGQVNFAKAGGILSVAEYEEHAPEEMINNDNQHLEKEIDKEHTYSNYAFENDIKLEAGKTYVFFTNYVKETNMYVVDGVQYGTREVISNEQKSGFRSMPSTSLKIKDNDTNEYSSYDVFKETYFK